MVIASIIHYANTSQVQKETLHNNRWSCLKTSRIKSLQGVVRASMPLVIFHHFFREYSL
jgi:hypothetical protein